MPNGPKSKRVLIRAISLWKLVKKNTELKWSPVFLS
jgi:hypothetical protein